MKGPPTADEVHPFASTWVQPGSTVYTDGARAHEVLAAKLSWTHHTIIHKKGEWVRNVGTKKVHMNKIDGLWGHVRFINARFGTCKHRLNGTTRNLSGAATPWTAFFPQFAASSQSRRPWHPHHKVKCSMWSGLALN